MATTSRSTSTKSSAKNNIKKKAVVQKKLALPFKVGDVAVYPAHGVGEIKSIENKEIAGSRYKFYVLQILDNGMKIMVPTQKTNAVGLREIISKSEVEAVYAILRERDVAIDNQTWNRRYREYMDKIKTGSIYEIAEVYRDLKIIATDKELSFGERKLLDSAQNLLVKELAFAENRDEDEILVDLQDIFDE